MKILVTGASGFMARALLARLKTEPGIEISTLSRKKELPEVLDATMLEHCFASADFTDLLTGIDVVVHTAARAHVLKEIAFNPLDEYRKVNVDFTLNLARQAQAKGVKRLIYISSIGVNGVTSQSPFTHQHEPAPEEPYALSKLEAEIGLESLCETMELVIIRPPLTYGPGAPGNFARMVKALKRGIPLPLGAINNQRSFIGVDNLVDLITVCLDHPLAAGQVFLACDGEDISTPQLLRMMAKAMGKPSRIVSAPLSLISLACALVGRKDAYKRLSGSLQVDMDRTQEILGWTPPVSLEEGIKRCFTDPSAFQQTGANSMTIRTADIALGTIGLIASAPVLGLLVAIGYLDTGSPILRQERVGKNLRVFTLYKLRTMKLGTQEVATHLADASRVTRFGVFLRKSKLDELPQLINVIKGDMSLVGPRPGLKSQRELAAERHKLDVFAVRPGITGLGQVSGVDMSTPGKLAMLDAKMIKTLCLSNYLRYIALTLTGRGMGDRIKR